MGRCFDGASNHTSDHLSSITSTYRKEKCAVSTQGFLTFLTFLAVEPPIRDWTMAAQNKYAPYGGSGSFCRQDSPPRLRRRRSREGREPVR